MARPRTLGPPITFRLPLDAHNVIAERADANGETVNDYVCRYLTRAAEQRQAQTPDIYGRGKPKAATEPRWKKGKKTA